MTTPGYLIIVDEERRGDLIKARLEWGDTFSDALSAPDWRLREGIGVSLAILYYRGRRRQQAGDCRALRLPRVRFPIRPLRRLPDEIPLRYSLARTRTDHDLVQRNGPSSGAAADTVEGTNRGRSRG